MDESFANAKELDREKISPAPVLAGLLVFLLIAWGAVGWAAYRLLGL